MMRTWSVQSARFRIGFATLIILLLASGAGALSNSGGGSWWYYRDITISNTGSDLTDYQVLVSLNSGNFPLNAQTNGADIRFMDAGGAELSYWIESWDYAGRNAKIWVNVTSIAASGGTTIRMWYGNPSAGSSSNGALIFPFFDDFNAASLSSKWTSSVSPEGRGSVTVSNGMLNLIANPTPGPSGTWSVGEFVQVKSTVNFSLPYRLFFRFSTNLYISTEPGGPRECNQLGGMSDYSATAIQPLTDNGGVSNGIIHMWSQNAGNPRLLTISASATTRTNFDYLQQPNIFKTFKYFANSSSVGFVLNDTVIANHTTNISTTPLPIMFEASQAPSGYSRCGYYDVTIPSEYHVDYVFLAKYVTSDPSVSVGAEETYGLVGYWRFDEGDGNTTADSSGNGNNGTLYNFDWNANSNWVDGKLGKALRFDGSNDYVSIPDAPSFTISEVTVEGWIKPDNTIFQGIVTNHANGVNSDGSWVLYKSDKACFIIFTSTGEQLSACGGSISTGSWQHIAATWNSSSGSKIYLNGVNVGNVSTSGTLPDPANPTEIGRYHVYNPSNQYWFSGIIDEVRIYNRTLSAEEINAHYEQGAGAPMGNSIGYSAIVATGQITSVVATNGSFGLIPKSQTKTINNSVVLNNTGDLSARVEARFNDSIAGVFGLISGANVLNATNFALGIPGVLMPLNNSGTDVQVVFAPPGVTAMDARLGVPGEQAAGDYSGTVVLTFSNNV